MTLTTICTGSSGNCYVLRDASSALVLEAGGKPLDVLKTGVQLSEIVAVLITHEHQDHARYAAMWDYRYHRPVYCSLGTAHALRCKSAVFRTAIFGGLLMEGNWHIVPFMIRHDAAQPVGWYIANGAERILFVTDTAPIAYNFRGMRPTTIIVESNWCQDKLERMDDIRLAGRISRSHLSDEMAADLIRANATSDLRHIVLTHLSNDNSDEARAMALAQQAAPTANVYAARAGQTIDISTTIYNAKYETK